MLNKSYPALALGRMVILLWHLGLAAKALGALHFFFVFFFCFFFCERYICVFRMMSFDHFRVMFLKRTRTSVAETSAKCYT